MAAGSRLDYPIIAQPYTPDKDEFIAVMHPVWTSAELADTAHRVNVKDKFLGKAVYDSDLGEPVYATGSAPGDAWAVGGASAAAPVTATTAELADIADAINTTGKAVGKMVFNTTTGIPVWADGAAAGDTWSGADGIVDHTPV